MTTGPTRAPWLTLTLSLVSAGCARGVPEVPSVVLQGNLRAFGVEGPLDPTERGARVVPEIADDARLFGVEPGGGVRGITSGVRVINLPTGAVLAAADRFPQARTPLVFAPIPTRLGGGFLFVLDPSNTVVWRADHWLSPAKPIYSSPSTIVRVVVGLDRVYLRDKNGAHQAIDVRTGARLDLGPWPGSSFVGQYAALDGWRAAAVSDLRGLVATTDAGATWNPIDLPIDPQDVFVVDEAIVVRGLDAAKQSVWFEVRDGRAARLPGPPPPPGKDPLASASLSSAARPFGVRPLQAAIEDGWPLRDGTAVVARDGALARVRLGDGALVDLAPDAFALRPSRCHAVALPRPGAPGGFGFVCGEPHGRTVIFGYDAARAALTELRRFDHPRVVLASGNGALTVRGACAADAPADDEDPTQQSYCLGERPGSWREIHVRGDIGGERVVSLADGRVAIISPPHGEPNVASLTLVDGSRATTVPIVFTALEPEVVHLLHYAVWLDGFEERRPGVLSGWVEAAGTMIGIEVTLDGHATHGDYVRDAGMPIVSGRYGLGWTASRRGYETTDGGMRWTPLDVPEPSATNRPARVRACGPIGCSVKGWLRVGWGASANPVLPPPPPVYASYRPPRSLELDCEPVGAPLPAPAKEGTALRHPEPEAPFRATSPFEWPPTLLEALPPSRRADEVVLSVEASEPVERQVRASPLARLFAWGPKSGEWPHAAHWAARWLWPYGGSSQDLRASQSAPAPFDALDTARRVLGIPVPIAGNSTVTWTAGIGDDPTHALLVGRRNGQPETTVLELEADRAIVEVHRSDREPFTEVSATLRLGGHWYLATSSAADELPSMVLWEIDGMIAHEIARVPRAAVEGKSSGARLARRSDGRAIGLVIDGQPGTDRAVSLRWVMPVELDSGALGKTELLGTSDLGDRPDVPICEGDEVGWVMDAPWNATVRVHTGERDQILLTNLYARLRLTRARACLERLSGSFDAQSSTGDSQLRPLTITAHGDRPILPVSALSARTRYALRCVGR